LFEQVACSFSRTLYFSFRQVEVEVLPKVPGDVDLPEESGRG
jgi:hypothetical protein